MIAPDSYPIEVLSTAYGQKIGRNAMATISKSQTPASVRPHNVALRGFNACFVPVASKPGRSLTEGFNPMTLVSTGIRGGCTSEPDGVRCGAGWGGAGFLISPVVLTFGRDVSEPEPVFDTGAVSGPDPVFGAGFVNEPDPGLGSGCAAGLISIRSSAGGSGADFGSGLGADRGAGSVRTAGCAAGFLASNGLELSETLDDGGESGFGSTRLNGLDSVSGFCF